MSYMLKLPDERGAQLRQIAAAKNTTVPELIAGYVRAEIEAGTITATVPGIDLASEGDVITIKAHGFQVSIPMNEGPTLADLLRGSASAAADPARKQRWAEGMAALSGVKLKRMGAGVRLVSPFTGAEYPLTFGVAEDLGDEIAKVTR